MRGLDMEHENVGTLFTLNGLQQQINPSIKLMFSNKYVTITKSMTITCKIKCT